MAARTLLVCVLMLGVRAVAAQPAPSAPSAPSVPSGTATSGPSVGDLRSQGKLAVERMNDGPLRVARRSVAVIDLANDPAVRELANRLFELLAVHAELAPLAISDGAALVDKMADDEPRLAEARRKRLAAEQSLAQRNFREAAIEAVEGQELLLHVAPPDAVALYADLSLALGLSRLGEKKDADAREAFALTRRLDPARTLDDLRYLPEVVQTFEAVARRDPGMGAIAVRGSGRVWIDGAEVGTAPGEFRVPLGRHVVWLTGLLRETAGKEVLVTGARPVEAAIADGPLSRPQKVARFRGALAQARDPQARVAAMTALGAFVNTHDAVLLWLENGQLMWQLWRDQAPWFSAPRALGSDPPAEILRSIAPPHPPYVAGSRALPPAPRWYLRRPVQIGVAASVVMAVLGSYLWSRYTEPDRPWNTDIKAGSSR